VDPIHGKLPAQLVIAVAAGELDDVLELAAIVRSLAA
jgi:hypothetical protein